MSTPNVMIVGNEIATHYLVEELVAAGVKVVRPDYLFFDTASVLKPEAKDSIRESIVKDKPDVVVIYRPCIGFSERKAGITAEDATFAEDVTLALVKELKQAGFPGGVVVAEEDTPVSAKLLLAREGAKTCENTTPSKLAHAVMDALGEQGKTGFTRGKSNPASAS